MGKPLEFTVTGRVEGVQHLPPPFDPHLLHGTGYREYCSSTGSQLPRHSPLSGRRNEVDDAITLITGAAPHCSKLRFRTLATLLRYHRAHSEEVGGVVTGQSLY